MEIKAVRKVALILIIVVAGLFALGAALVYGYDWSTLRYIDRAIGTTPVLEKHLFSEGKKLVYDSGEMYTVTIFKGERDLLETLESKFTFVPVERQIVVAKLMLVANLFQEKMPEDTAWLMSEGVGTNKAQRYSILLNRDSDIAYIIVWYADPSGDY